jgi:asparagine synthase (glutamine-hydrolysing)
MCGIVGIVDPNLDAQGAEQCTRTMADRIVHRGPDDQGHFASVGCSIGMRRLSIIDLSGGHQPIGNEAGDIQVVCNGEIYNFVELRQSLLSKGHQFRTGSDTEVIVHLYEEYGDECLQHLRGMFGLAILDMRRGKRVLIARDRLGKKPLFYSNRNGRLLFGSEMKSLLAASPELAAPDYSTLGEYFQFGYIHQPRTVYRDIQRLPAAHYAVFENNQLTIKPYWQLNFEPDESLTEADWQEQLDETLAESVRIRLRSDVPLGVFLSGGLDSSAVVAYASLAGLKPLKTFTIGFDRKEWDESEDAALVAQHYDTEHHQLRLEEAAMRDSLDETLFKIAGYFDEPFGDSSAIPTYHVSRLAREHVTVVLSGDGGDELLAGYSIYRGMLFAQQYRKWLPQWFGGSVLPTTVETLSRLMPGSLRYKGLRAGKVFRDSSLPPEQAVRDKASIWKAREIQSLLVPEVAEQCNFLQEQFIPDKLWKILRGNGDIVSRLSEIDIQSYMLDDILVKVDRMSMAHSLEVRSPLLDHRVAELAARIPTRMKIRGNLGKLPLRNVLKDKLPPRSLRKGKQGFSMPLRDWFRHGLSGWVRDYLGPGGHLPSEIFSQAKVQSVLQEHQQGRFDHSRKIWLLLAFAAWHRQYQCGSSSVQSSLGATNSTASIPTSMGEVGR